VLADLIRRNRSYRRFDQDATISSQTLRALIDHARLSACAQNLQPLKYFISCDPDTNALIFPYLGWAGYLEDWPGPAEGERPSGYIIILGDREISKSFNCDHGIAAQSILLGAVEQGLGGCIIGSIQRPALRRKLRIPSQFKILLVIALGKPREKVAIDEVGPESDIRYWRDEEGIHHVPKRSLDEIVIS
jgi:nitroreductase